ncbi:DUF6716 putative glycosyltransferase [Microbacterium amylolyticum]|uniref:Uncharacterized protein n=1 Tax=Microbacterium amylolyticum TaxID=936337 RepID=A0ABS4ZEH3_9MICO|nr:DUF6716 putative glycosyltransferase [Microbacterium amylolyticum]MBP2435674.1 hypothetical protein [Microbacterium amylolyticum]
MSLRVVAVADTDSYVKWAAWLLGSADVDGTLVVLDTELVVTDGQLSRALAGAGLDQQRVARTSLDDLPHRLIGADVVLVAARGPVARVIARVAAHAEPRAVRATGLPGISIPATWRALHFRRACEMFILHSRREVSEFAALAVERGITQRFALATLPFARQRKWLSSDEGTDLVFAAQARIPADPAERLRVARILVRAAEADPSRRVVLKLRGRPGEHETHREDDPYPAMLAAIGQPHNLVISYEPMSAALVSAQGLVTVSSTAAIEAAAHGVPVIALDTFGIDDALINTVFHGSGLLAGEEEVIARNFRHPAAEWLDENYFHDPADDTWVALAQSLVEERQKETSSPVREERQTLLRTARFVWERRLALGNRDTSAAGRAAFVVGVPARGALRLFRRVRRRLARTS